MYGRYFDPHQVSFKYIQKNNKQFFLSETAHETLTNIVMERLKTARLKLNHEKCVFGETWIKFLGNIFTDEGLEPDDTKIEAIKKLKTRK
jgi:hypothetical protein